MRPHSGGSESVKRSKNRNLLIIKDHTQLLKYTICTLIACELRRFAGSARYAPWCDLRGRPEPACHSERHGKIRSCLRPRLCFKAHGSLLASERRQCYKTPLGSLRPDGHVSPTSSDDMFVRDSPTGLPQSGREAILNEDISRWKRESRGRN